MGHSFLQSITERIRIWRDIIWRGWWGKLILGICFVVGLFDAVQTQFLPGIKLPPIIDLLPGWSWWVWVLIWLGILWVATLEGAYRQIQRVKPQDNWIDAHKVKTGKLPPLPDYLVPLFGNYSSGPVSKGMKPITPSGQCWNRLLPSQRKQWRQLVEWLGEDPEDYLAHMRMMLPQTPKGVERIKWKPPEQC